MRNNNRIQREIKKLDRKQKRAINAMTTFLGLGMVTSIVSWVLLFLAGTAYYLADNYFYLTIDRLSENIISGIFKITLIASAFAAFAIYGYYREKKSLKRILNKRKRVVR